MDLNFRVSKQIISRKDKENVVADSKNYLYAAFSFSGEWIGTKTAIFKSGDNACCVILEGDRCLVPWEVIKTGWFTVSVFCGDLVTSNKAVVRVLESGYAQGETPSDPTPDVYQQIIELLNEINRGTVSEETIAEAVEKYMKENPVDLSSYATETYVNNAINNIDLSGYALATHNHNGAYQPVEEGKGLSTNDFTNTLKSKLEGIAEGAEVNVNADWNQNDKNGAGYIKNRTHYVTTEKQETDLGMVEVSNVAVSQMSSGSLGICTIDVSDRTEDLYMADMITFAYESPTQMLYVKCEWTDAGQWQDKKTGITINYSNVFVEREFIVSNLPAGAIGETNNHISLTFSSTEDVEVITQLDQKYIPDTIATKDYVDSKQIQSDWNQNDETAIDYVKNKPTIPEDYTLPTASPTALGGVMPVAKTDAMTQDVGVDEDGKLYTAPGSGGASEEWEEILNTTLTMTEAVSVLSLNLSKTDTLKRALIKLELPKSTTTGITEAVNVEIKINGAAVGYFILKVNWNTTNQNIVIDCNWTCTKTMNWIDSHNTPNSIEFNNVAIKRQMCLGNQTNDGKLILNWGNSQYKGDSEVKIIILGVYKNENI